ncbi:hypothetical protein [Jiella pacifica]|uniref:Uncharacterized protein n=1 Tax=Jiella pacifica TaxID=2696469 RepID=A0A6N9T4Y7_9HYPH|nr:hypothetical protein [Jiella pacifica]NDW04018.1 hypothetical protein [Jiella pacifica]
MQGSNGVTDVSPPTRRFARDTQEERRAHGDSGGIDGWRWAVGAETGLAER